MHTGEAMENASGPVEHAMAIIDRADRTQQQQEALAETTFCFRYYLEAVTMAGVLPSGKDFMRVPPMNLLS